MKDIVKFCDGTIQDNLTQHKLINSTEVSLKQNTENEQYRNIKEAVLENDEPEACNFIKKEALAQVFSCEFCEISKNTFFTEHLMTTASLCNQARQKFSITTLSLLTQVLEEKYQRKTTHK